MSESLHATHVLEFPYTRSLGPVLGEFFTGLRERRIVGGRLADGRVTVPPMEADPVTGAPCEDFVEVGDAGEVTSWAWVSRPRPRHPLDRPFAWALVRLDGADTALVHVVDAGSAGAMRTGMRVRARWAGETTGCITDVACFAPEDGASP